MQIFRDNQPQHYAYIDYTLFQFAIRHNLETLYTGLQKSNKIDLHQTTSDGKNLLYLAAESGDINLIYELINKGLALISPNKRHFFYALVEHNHHEILRELILEYGYNINESIDNITQLRVVDLACKLGNLDTILGVIGSGADITAINPQTKRLALYYAIENNMLQVLRLLFKYEIDTQLESILTFAIEQNKGNVFVEIIKLNPHYTSVILTHAKSLLFCAIKNNNLDISKKLLALGANSILDKDSVAEELLQTAVENNSSEIVRLIISYGININFKSKNIIAIFNLANQLGYDLCVKEFMDMGKFTENYTKLIKQRQN